MKTFLIIYSIGLIWAYLLLRHDYIHNEKSWCVKDLIASILCCLFSWIVVIFCYCYDFYRSGFWTKIMNKKLPPWI